MSSPSQFVQLCCVHWSHAEWWNCNDFCQNSFDRWDLNERICADQYWAHLISFVIWYPPTDTEAKTLRSRPSVCAVDSNIALWKHPLSRQPFYFDWSVSRRQLNKKKCNLSLSSYSNSFWRSVLFLTLVPLSSWRSVCCFPLHSLQDLSDEQSLIVSAPKQLKHRWCFLTCSRLNRISKPRLQIVAVFVFGTKLHKLSVRTSMWIMLIKLSVLIRKSWKIVMKMAVFYELVSPRAEVIIFTLIERYYRKVRPEKKFRLQAWAYMCVQTNKCSRFGLDFALIIVYLGRYGRTG